MRCVGAFCGVCVRELGEHMIEHNASKGEAWAGFLFSKILFKIDEKPQNSAIGR